MYISINTILPYKSRLKTEKKCNKNVCKARFASKNKNTGAWRNFPFLEQQYTLHRMHEFVTMIVAATIWLCSPLNNVIIVIGFISSSMFHHGPPIVEGQTHCSCRLWKYRIGVKATNYNSLSYFSNNFECIYEVVEQIWGN